MKSNPDLALIVMMFYFWKCNIIAKDKPYNHGFAMDLQYIPRNMHTVFALLCFVVVIHWLIFPYPSGLLHWHCGNLTIAPVPAKQPWWIWIKYFMWINYERLHNHNKAKHNKTVCIFLGIYCTCIRERMMPVPLDTISIIMPRMISSAILYNDI